MLVRLVTGCSWEDAERLCDRKVSDTAVRSRRDEWVEAGVFEAMMDEALGAYETTVLGHVRRHGVPKRDRRRSDKTTSAPPPI